MIKPLRGFCLIQPLEAEEQSEGVYLPDSSKETQAKGKILAVGSGSYLTGTDTCLPPEVMVGDIVFHKRFVDNHIKDGDKELLLVPFGDILAIIK
jgi:co-chaperonin GroES (HSP10)